MVTGRPSKTASIIKMEGKSHRTKAELATREKGEAAALTGYPIAETDDVANDKIAHAAFQRVTMILSQMGKNDEAHGESVRRYCVVKSLLADTMEQMHKLKAKRSDDYNADLEKAIETKETRATNYRKELLELERETGLTLASSLRMVPKQPDKMENPFKEAMIKHG